MLSHICERKKSCFAVSSEPFHSFIHLFIIGEGDRFKISSGINDLVHLFLCLTAAAAAAPSCAIDGRRPEKSRGQRSEIKEERSKTISVIEFSFIENFAFDEVVKKTNFLIY